MPVVDNPMTLVALQRLMRYSIFMPAGGTPIMALALVAMPINVLSHEDISRFLKAAPMSVMKLVFQFQVVTQLTQCRAYLRFSSHGLGSS